MDVNLIQQKPRSNKFKWVIILFVLFLLCAICAFCMGMFYLMVKMSEEESVKDGRYDIEFVAIYGNKQSENKYLSIPINGIILDDIPMNGVPIGAYQDITFGYYIKYLLIQAAQDESINGVILEITSPGGTIAGTKAIADGVEFYKNKTGKPVISYVLSMAASGGYWAASSTDYIFADYGSLTGSIGVIYGPFKYYDTVIAESDDYGSISTQNGIETFYITGGKYKDFGSPYRKLSDEELTLIQEDIDNEYDNFVKYISKHRNISENDIKNKIKSLPYGNKTAIANKLIDKEGTREQAYQYLADLDSIGEDYQIISPEVKFSVWDLFMLEGNTIDNLLPKNCTKLCSRPIVLEGNPLDYAY